MTPRSAIAIRLLASALLLFVAAPLAAQSSTRSARLFTIAPGVAALQIGDLNGTAVGPTLQMARRLGNHLAIDGVFTAYLSSDGFYDFSGLSLDLGLSYLVRGPSYALAFGAGGAAIVGGDSDGTGGAFAGGYVGTTATYWFSERVGVTSRGTYRMLSAERGGLGIAGGIAFTL